nr:MAG TPA: hypothetical protein [Caudoviricetes sp.]DAV28337.1 MAG TPA: hypothetical protein [Caudoviricetes sp.]
MERYARSSYFADKYNLICTPLLFGFEFIKNYKRKVF